jgi:hypothetical protein
VARVMLRANAPPAHVYVGLTGDSTRLKRPWRNNRATNAKIVDRTGIKDHRELVFSATGALRLVLHHMKLRRPVEDERGNPVSFFELKEMAALEGVEKKPGGPPT